MKWKQMIFKMIFLSLNRGEQADKQALKHCVSAMEHIKGT